MARSHIDHPQIARYATARVNLPQDRANQYRAQVRRLRGKLKKYLDEHPDFSLRRMQLSGSLAKGTALRSLNDIDVAVYIAGSDIPSEVRPLLDYLAERLRTAFPNFNPDQVTLQTYSVRVSFRGSGLDVDVVPIIYSGSPDWRGNLVSQEDGSLLETSIPLHLEFLKKRKDEHPGDFTQVVRLLKHWVNHAKLERPGFRFKSFLVELVLSRLSDRQVSFSDYPEALQQFFTYVASRLQEPIVFGDFYDPAGVDTSGAPLQIFDPVNSKNNVCRLYTAQDAAEIMDRNLSTTLRHFANQFSEPSFPWPSAPSPGSAPSTSLTGSARLIQTSALSSAARGGPATKRSGRAA